MTFARNSVHGSSRKKPTPNLSNTYGIKAQKANLKPGVTQGKPANKNSAQSLKSKMRG